MAYIGRDTDKISNVEVLDNITFDGSSSYTLQKNSVNFTPSSANTLLVSIDGVVQAGNFTVSGSTIDFGTAVAGTSTCDFILHYGVGLITTPADGTVTTDKIGSNAVTSAKITYPLTTFSSTGIDDNATSTAITIDSSENVGIGTTNPTDTNGYGKALDIQGSTGAAIYVGSSGDRGIFGYTSGEQHISNPSASGTTRFYINAAEQMRINSAGAMLLGTTTAGSASAGDLVVNGGVFLGGTATANELDDYEEGTFTPTFTSTSASFSYSYQNGYYTKIGRSVTCHIFIRGQSSGTTSNSLFISGLPFTSLNSSSLYASGSFGQIESVNYSGGVDIIGHVSPNQSQITLQYSRDDTTTLGLPASAVDKGTSSGFMFSINYFAD
jgi:hypothetical protein